MLAAYDDPLTDYQGVVFKDRSDQTLYLAHRGTTIGRDILADVDLALLSGLARDQVAAMVNWWNDIALPAGTAYRRVDTVPFGATDPRTFVDAGAATASGTIAAEVAAASAAGRLRVVGHSLGGHLTTVFASLFHDQVSHSSTFNGAGLFSTPTLAATLANALLGAPLQQVGSVIGRSPRLPDASTQDNFYAAHGVNFTTNDLTFVQRGERIGLYNEYTSEPFVSLMENHSQYKLTDSLALFQAFEKFAPGVTLDALAGIAERGSNVQAASLEAMLDAMRKALTGPAIAPTPPSDDGGDGTTESLPPARIEYHRNLTELQDPERGPLSTLAGKLEIVPSAARGAAALADEARSDFGSFVALRDLSAFSLAPKPGAEAAGEKLNAVWQQARATEHAAWLADVSARADHDAESALNYTDAWYADRASMLEWNLRRNLADGPPPEARSVAEALRFDDLITGTTFDIASPKVTYPRWSKIAFGRDDMGETLTGDTQHDRIYGGGGADAIAGDAGDDYLEGNAGDDTLNGGPGRDELLGGADADRLDGGADADWLDGGHGPDRLDGGAGDDRLFGGPGADILAGGADRDRHRRRFRRRRDGRRRRRRSTGRWRRLRPLSLRRRRRCRPHRRQRRQGGARTRRQRALRWGRGRAGPVAQ